MDDLQQAMLAALHRAFNQHIGDEIDAQRAPRTLRIALAETEGPAWSGDALALMRPAPSGSSDAQWAAALRLDATSSASSPARTGKGPQPLPVRAPAGLAFGYPQVREYAAELLTTLAKTLPETDRVVLTLPGISHGLDEGACLEHLLLGLVDALAVQPAPPAVRELVLLESNDARRQLIENKLDQLLTREAGSTGGMKKSRSWPLVYYAAADDAHRCPSPFEQHLTYMETLTAFVAMPFKPEMRDVFQYGIQGPALKAKFKAERLDFEHFTGSVIEQIKDRIQRAHLVIADMTEANANVFLEIGYAWGKGRPTVLLCRKATDDTETRPPFDVATESRIEYTDIGHLDKELTEKLQALYPKLRQRMVGPD